MKDILIIRFTKEFSDFEIDDKKDLEKNLSERLKNIYTVMFIYNENDTDKTEFEIIKY